MDEENNATILDNNDDKKSVDTPPISAVGVIVKKRKVSKRILFLDIANPDVTNESQTN